MHGRNVTIIKCQNRLKNKTLELKSYQQIGNEDTQKYPEPGRQKTTTTTATTKTEWNERMTENKILRERKKEIDRERKKERD